VNAEDLLERPDWEFPPWPGPEFILGPANLEPVEFTPYELALRLAERVEAYFPEEQRVDALRAIEDACTRYQIQYAQNWDRRGVERKARANRRARAFTEALKRGLEESLARYRRLSKEEIGLQGLNYVDMMRDAEALLKRAEASLNFQHLRPEPRTEAIAAKWLVYRLDLVWRDFGGRPPVKGRSAESRLPPRYEFFDQITSVVANMNGERLGRELDKFRQEHPETGENCPED
jgi:hypothetical protein